MVCRYGQPQFLPFGAKGGLLTSRDGRLTGALTSAAYRTRGPLNPRGARATRKWVGARRKQHYLFATECACVASVDSMTQIELSERVIAQMLNSDAGTTAVDPVCQVLSIKKLQTTNANANVSERYRVVLSDGVYYTQGTYAAASYAQCA